MYSQKKFSVNDIYNNSFHQLPSFFFLEDFPKISDKAIILYSLLKSRHELSIKNRWFDKEGNEINQIIKYRQEHKNMKSDFELKFEYQDIDCLIVPDEKNKQKFIKILKELNVKSVNVNIRK